MEEGGGEREKEKYSLGDVFSTGNFSYFPCGFVLFVIYSRPRSRHRNAAVRTQQTGGRLRQHKAPRAALGSRRTPNWGLHGPGGAVRSRGLHGSDPPCPAPSPTPRKLLPVPSAPVPAAPLQAHVYSNKTTNECAVATSPPPAGSRPVGGGRDGGAEPRIAPHGPVPPPPHRGR